MGNLRPTAVAGLFYAAEPAALAGDVAGYLDAAKAPVPEAAPKALIVPHAGYVYSGPVAGHAFAALRGFSGRVSRVVVIGPSHFFAFEGLAAPSVEGFETPLGPLTVDRAAIAGLAAIGALAIDDRPHAREHALEVQLPFIRQTLGDVAIVPLLVGAAAAETVGSVIERLWGGEETLIVISSDLSHYHPYDDAQCHDAATAAAIEALAAERLIPDDACGSCALAGFLPLARRRGLAIKRLDLRNSGDIASERDRVVGYGAWALYDKCAG